MSALEDSSHDQANQDEGKQAEQLECQDICFALGSCSAGQWPCSSLPCDARCRVWSPADTHHSAARTKTRSSAFRSPATQNFHAQTSHFSLTPPGRGT